jgi:hypothetical protein
MRPSATRPDRWSGRTWLGIGVGFLCLSIFSTVVAFGSGFDFDPDDYPGSYYLHEIPRRQWIMAVSVVIPLVSALAAGMSILARPRTPGRILTASAVVILAAVAVWACWVLGVEAVDSARYFSEKFPG